MKAGTLDLDDWSVTRKGDDGVLHLKATHEDWQRFGQALQNLPESHQITEIRINLNNFFKGYKILE